MPQAHDLITMLIGMALGAVAAHFHPGTITRKRRQADAAKPVRRSPREKKAAKQPIPLIAPE